MKPSRPECGDGCHAGKFSVFGFEFEQGQTDLPYTVHLFGWAASLGILLMKTTKERTLITTTITKFLIQIHRGNRLSNGGGTGSSSGE